MHYIHANQLYRGEGLFEAEPYKPEDV